MKLEPTNVIADTPLKELSPLERKCYYTAVVVAFLSVFVWVIKILFL
ncbi:hypothetical protein [Mucilaginibacter flavidus]|nr:hypothetical protein [Mucilaginibacter flavidus]